MLCGKTTVRFLTLLQQTLIPFFQTTKNHIMAFESRGGRGGARGGRGGFGGGRGGKWCDLIEVHAE